MGRVWVHNGSGLIETRTITHYGLFLNGSKSCYPHPSCRLASVTAGLAPPSLDFTVNLPPRRLAGAQEREGERKREMRGIIAGHPAAARLCAVHRSCLPPGVVLTVSHKREGEGEGQWWCYSSAHALARLTTVWPPWPPPCSVADQHHHPRPPQARPSIINERELSVWEKRLEGRE